MKTNEKHERKDWDKVVSAKRVLRFGQVQLGLVQLQLRG